MSGFQRPSATKQGIKLRIPNINVIFLPSEVYHTIQYESLLEYQCHGQEEPGQRKPTQNDNDQTSAEVPSQVIGSFGQCPSGMPWDWDECNSSWSPRSNTRTGHWQWEASGTMKVQNLIPEIQVIGFLKQSSIRGWDIKGTDASLRWIEYNKNFRALAKLAGFRVRQQHLWGSSGWLHWHSRNKLKMSSPEKQRCMELRTYYPKQMKMVIAVFPKNPVVIPTQHFFYLQPLEYN